MSGGAQGIQSAPVAARTPPLEEPSRLALLVILGLALAVLPFVFHKARQEWRS